MSSTISDVANFFTNRNLLITGGSGFLGKVLIEKLLRSIPDLQRIYVIIRSQKGLDAGQRWSKIVEGELFDLIRCVKTGDANLLDKVVPINGDITESDLGLSEDDLRMICENVSVVFHCAATVRFDERLKLAVKMNVEGTQRLLRLCDRMKKLDVFVHASTAYCNCDRQRVLEQVYPSPAPWRQLVDASEWMNDQMLDQLTPYLIGQRPNTYCFTKAVAESMIVDDGQSNQHLPIVIVRPSIVTATLREPMPGWIDNWNGATGLIALGAKGLLRSLYGNLNQVKADLVPVDIVANTLIVAAWHRGSAKGSPMPVIHCTTGELNPTTWGQVIETTVHNFTHIMPLADLIRIPGGRCTTWALEHRIRLFVDHFLPAYMLDMVSKMRGQRPTMVRAYEKITKLMTTLQYFYSREWYFESNGITSLIDLMSEYDRRVFNIDVKSIDWIQYYIDYHAGVRKHIFKESPTNLDVARRVQSRRRLINRLVIVIILAFFCLMIAKIFM